MYMYVRHVITRRKPIAACAEIAIVFAICEEIAFFTCPNTAKIRHGHGRLEHQAPRSMSQNPNYIRLALTPPSTTIYR